MDSLERLLLLQCDPSLEPLFIYRKDCWTVDASGITQKDYAACEVDSSGVVPDDFSRRNPDIRFFIHGSTIRLYMCFGHGWGWRKQASLDVSGHLLRDTLQDLRYWTPSKSFGFDNAANQALPSKG